jgi:hypothetical protein
LWVEFCPCARSNCWRCAHTPCSFFSLTQPGSLDWMSVAYCGGGCVVLAWLTPGMWTHTMVLCLEINAGTRMASTEHDSTQQERLFCVRVFPLHCCFAGVPNQAPGPFPQAWSHTLNSSWSHMFKSSGPAGFSRGGGRCGGRYGLTRACTANCVVLVCTPCSLCSFFLTHHSAIHLVPCAGLRCRRTSWRHPHPECLVRLGC